MWKTWTYSQRENQIGQFTPTWAVQTMNLMISVSLGVIWLFFPPGSRARVSLQPNQNNWLVLSLPINNWRWCFLLLTINTMSKKTSRLSKLDVSVLEAQMRCGSEWPIGLVDAIAEAHRTTIENVIERQHALSSEDTQEHKLNIYFWHNFRLPMFLLELKDYGSKITSTPTMNSSILLLYKLGEKRMGMSKLKEKVTAKAAPSTPKQGTTKPWLYWKQSKHFIHQSHV